MSRLSNDPAVLLDAANNTVADAVAVAALAAGTASGPLTTEFGTGTSNADNYASRVSVDLNSQLIVTEIVIDIDGLASEATLADIIGDGTDANANIGQVVAESGTIFAGTVECIEAPVTGEIDIDLYSATVGTGAAGSLVTALTETALMLAAANWTAGDVRPLTAFPAADEFLYLSVGTASTPTAGTYTAGIFKITLYGK